jgi:hypothetical protein
MVNEVFQTMAPKSSVVGQYSLIGEVLSKHQREILLKPWSYRNLTTKKWMLRIAMLEVVRGHVRIVFNRTVGKL